MRRSLAVWFAAFALATRVVIPFGFMPASGQGYAITLCTGDGMVDAWVDEAGKVHKERKAPGQSHDRPCAFAGVSAFVQATLPEATPPATVGPDGRRWSDPEQASIGQGLAAPPPPSTGPPQLA